MPYVPIEVIEYLKDNPLTEGTDLFRLGLATSSRTGRRWAQYVREGVADPGEIDIFPVRHKYDRVTMRATVFDLEVTDFSTDGYAGYLVAASFFPLDAEVPYSLYLNYEDHGDDRRLIEEVVQELSKFDILIGHNIAAFDLNWLHSKIIFHDMKPLRSWYYFDTYQVTAKSMTLATRRSLGNLGAYFGLEGVKTSIYKKEWNDVRSFNEKVFEEALDEIVYHCEQDVILNRALLDRVWPRHWIFTSKLQKTKWRNASV